MSSEKSKNADMAHVSLFPSPPWQLVNRHQTGPGASQEPPIRPPTPPGQTVYRMFGNLYNLDDAILRSLESQGVRRVYPQVDFAVISLLLMSSNIVCCIFSIVPLPNQTYNRKRELRKINFSILANYLDLLDIITRDPSSPKRTERLDNLAILFINMHHLVNEYRQHQARDLLREILSYQVSIASQTVEKAELYTTRANDLLRNAGQELIVPGQPSVTFNVPGVSTNCVDTVRSGLVELGPTLAPLLQTVLDETMGGDPACRRIQAAPGLGSSSRLPGNLLDHPGSQSSLDCFNSDGILDGVCGDDPADHVDPSLWQFLSECQLDDGASYPDHCPG
ncbi:unnamed protein product [Echinostoma caproni]|uniref:Mediator of RNA polymerase II transcription subunit 7 n=1 Tax=Echinostoma caproni TaxID=27848 RepID=A0A183B5E9_9TREM|nr:unnamed protein product [Echinostoma caproni]